MFKELKHNGTMKKKFLIPVMLLISTAIFSQGVYNNGGTIVVGTGTFFVVGGTSGNYRNEANVTNGTIELRGTMRIEGNYINNVAGADVMNTAVTGGEMVIAGTTPQTLGGTTTAAFNFQDLTIDNNSGVIISKNLRVEGTFTLTAGLVDIGNNNFVFGSLSTVSGAPSASNMIIATGSGQVQKVWNTTGTFDFPVGDNDVTAEYSPVSLNFTSGTFAADAVAGLNLVNAKHTDPSVTGSYLNRYWNILQTGITGFVCDALFQYVAADVTGTESDITGLRVTPPPVTTYSAVNTTLHQFNANGLTSFGTFTGAGVAVNKTLNLSAVMLEGLYAGAGQMRQAWNGTGPNWPADIADHITIELRNSTNYATIEYTVTDVELHLNGTASVSIPATYSGTYYITIRHRNSIETTTALAVSLAGTIINQSFATTADVYGGNLNLSTDGFRMIYTGDVNQDGVIDSGDFTPVVNDANNYVAGYLVTDLDGNGSIDSGDFTFMVNNGNNYVGTIHP
jgi:hypothetical protein